jgi:sporulation protein YlmC with PRC-barrel domain
MKTIAALSFATLLFSTAPYTGAMAAENLMASIPASSSTVTNWYKQSVYDRNGNKIGEIMDVLLSQSGKTSALIVGVGGFLGAGEKDVAVGFDAVQWATKDGKRYLTMDTTKDALKAAPGFKYDSNSTTWVAAK